MQAVTYNHYGDPDVLSLGEIAKPEIKNKDEILIKVSYSAVNPVDFKIRSGKLESILPQRFPVIPGLDFSGVVVEKHPNSDCEIPIGAQVFGMKPGGTMAEFIVVNWKTDKVATMQSLEHLSMAEASGVGVAAMTAWTAYLDFFNVDPGQEDLNAKKTFLIIGASGGVGTFAVQLARSLGLQSIAVCSGRNAELVRGLGANIVVDYTQGPLNDQLQKLGYGVKSLSGILDLVGGDHYYTELKDLIQIGGRFVTATGPTNGKASIGLLLRFLGSYAARNVGSLFSLTVPYSFIYALPNRLWPSLIEHINKHKVKTIIHHVFPLKEASAAHTQSETGRTVGKIIVQVSSEI